MSDLLERLDNAKRGVVRAYSSTGEWRLNDPGEALLMYPPGSVRSWLALVECNGRLESWFVAECRLIPTPKEPQ